MEYTNGMYHSNPFLCSCQESIANSLESIGRVMVSMFGSDAENRWFDLILGETKGNKISICCFSPMHATLRIKSKHKLARNQDNM